MNTLVHADIFFFISSIGFIIFFVLGAVALWYVVGILKQVRKISDKVGDTVDGVSEDAKEFIHDLRGSGLYRMIFRKKRK